MRTRLALVVALVLTVGAAAAGPVPASVTLSGDTLAKVAQNWLATRFGPSLDPSTLERLGQPRDLLLPAGEATFTTTLQSGSLESGLFTVLVEAEVRDAQGQRTARSATVAFRVNAQVDVVVALRPLAQRTIVQADDVRIERRPMTRLAPDALRTVADVVGKEVLHPLVAGQPVSAAAVSPPRVIRRGAPVTLIVEGRNFRIMARGIADEDGYVGQTIRVTNQSSRRMVTGKVEDEGTVRIAF